jgi:hypothetical protein
MQILKKLKELEESLWKSETRFDLAHQGTPVY